MPDFNTLEDSFFDLDRGLPRLSAMREAIRQADEQQDILWMFRFRYDYVEESIFCGDRYHALILFPDLLSVYDSHPELKENPRIGHSMLVCFRWIVEAAPEFPQISREEIDGYFRLFKRRLLEQGYSLNIYYMKRLLFYMHVDKGVAAMCFYRFLEAPLDSISDGKALFCNQQVEYYLAIGEEEKALKAAEPILSGKLTGGNLPESTQHKLMRFYMRQGNYEEAQRYAYMFFRRVKGDPYYLHMVGSLLSLASVNGTPGAEELFRISYPLCQESRNPWLRMHFLFGAAHLYAKLAEDETAQPPEGFASVREAAIRFREQAEELAGKFDARNGTDDYTQMLHLLPTL